jgi:hypothetical protein
MPRKEIDYKKTIMYKIVCKDTTVKDSYVGQTTSFDKRKHNHRRLSREPRTKQIERSHFIGKQDFERVLYKKIRENGGWDNWSMIKIEDYPCKDRYEAEKRERELMEQYGATLNKVV